MPRRDGVRRAYPDTLVGTDSHTTMINGLGVLGWGVGGIEAEAAMLGQPVTMLIPQVVGFKLTGSLQPGATATDLVLTVTEILRKKGVVDKFVEFFGDGLANLPLADRATIGNMSPEFGSTCAIFPDRRRDAALSAAVGPPGRADRSWSRTMRAPRACGASTAPSPARVHRCGGARPGTVEPSLAGPSRPQDRVPLRIAKEHLPQHHARMAEERAPQESAAPPARRRSASTANPSRLRGRCGADRGDHQLHQHLQSVCADRRRAAGAQCASPRPEVPSPGSRPALRRARAW